MQHIELLMTAIEYIEVHLRDEIKTEDVSAVCFCSKSTLEKLFRSVHLNKYGTVNLLNFAQQNSQNYFRG